MLPIPIDNDANINKPEQPKKKPGRPPKAKPLILTEIKGIIDAPVTEGDKVNLTYNNPMMFKKLFRLFKMFSMSEVSFQFNRDSIQLNNTDHLCASRSYTYINGNKMNAYYCKDPIVVHVKRIDIENILKIMNKDNYEITILVNEEYRSRIYIIIKDSQYKTQTFHAVPTIYKGDNIINNDVEDDDSDYPIKFTVSSKYLKTRVNHIFTQSKIFTIEQNGQMGLLQFTHPQNISNRIPGEIFTDPNEIGLKSMIGPNDIFSINIIINYIRPFTNSIIGENVHIAAHSSKRIAFTTYMDEKNNAGNIEWTCRVKIFTKIQSYDDTMMRTIK